MKIAIIDFGSQWTHRIYRTLNYLEAESKILSVNTSLKEILTYDALIFSGGAIRIALTGSNQTGLASKYLEQFSGPILGICAGQQFIGLYFGGKARPSAFPEYGKVELFVDEKNELFEGLPDKFIVWASHNDEVIDTPNFRILAHTKSCTNHAFKSNNRPIWGCLFHPEVEYSEYGQEIYANFLKQVKR